MTHATVLDVLIVYNGHIAASASNSGLVTTTPFPPDSTCNAAYAHFLTTCHTRGLRAALSTSADITGPGTCQSYWTYAQESWIKHESPCRAKQIFDKFSPKDETTRTIRHLLFSHSSIKSFNSYSLFKLFFDKQKTYDFLPAYAIPTLALEDTSLDSIKKSCNLLKQHLQSQPTPWDFSDEVILKDRYGAGGRSIYKFKNTAYRSIRRTLLSSPHLSFILQPLIRFDRGFKYQNKFVSTDIRLIYLRGKMVSSYIRMAKAGDFRCNQHQGGSLVYITQKSLPLAVIRQSKKIATILNKQSSLFTLDFLLSNSGQAYLLEGNTGPGLSWSPTDQVDQIEAKKLIRQIVRELSSRVQPRRAAPPRPLQIHSLTSVPHSASIMV